MKPMKVILSMFLALIMCFTALPVASAEITGVTADGFEYEIKDGTVTITAYTGEATEVIIPADINGNTVTTIGERAFYSNDKITKVSIPDTVKVLENEAFYNCNILTEINLPKALEVIGEEVFCYSDIETIEIPNDTLSVSKLGIDNVDFESERVRIRTGAFEKCDKLNTVTFAEGVTRIPDNLLAGCTAIETITIPDTVETIGKNAFSYCLSLKDVSIPESVTDIQEEAFSNCLSLKEVKLPESLQKIGGVAFGESGLETVNIPASLDEVVKTTYSTSVEGASYSTCPGPFWRCESLKNVYIDDGVTEIIPYLFAGAQGLEKVTLPEGIEKIGQNAYIGCSSIDEVNLPESLTEIELNAFAGATSLKSLELPKKLEKLGERAFENTGIEEIEIPASLKEAEGDGNFNYYETPYGKAGIAYGPFYRCKFLKKVTFEKSVNEIPSYLFAGVFGLEEIEFNGNIKTIGKYTFSGCINLKELEFPESVESVGNYAFQGCIELEKISFKNPDTKLGSYTFRDCFALKDVTLPENIKDVAYGSFMNCKSLEAIEFPESVEEISGEAFSLCSSLDEVIIPEKLTEISNNCFAGCTSLKSIVIPENVHTVDFGAFRNCTALEDVKFTDYSVISIDSNAFDGCSTLDEIVLPKGLLTIEEEAFDNCPSLTKAVVPYSVKEIGEKGFTGDNVTIYSREGSYVHQYAIDNSLKFVNDYIPATTIEFIGESPVFIENFGKYRAQFKLTPEDSNEIITLSCDNDNIYISGLTVTPLNLKGTAVITATLENGNSCSFEVCSRLLESIEISALPDKTEYIPGEEIDITGLKVQGVYDNGDIEEITDYTLEGFSSADSGYVTVTVRYNEYTAEFTVRIKSKALLGDVNLDGKINIKDATAIQKHIAKLADLDDNNLKVADVNGDGKVNIKDATEIQKYIANILKPTETNVGKEIYI